MTELDAIAKHKNKYAELSHQRDLAAYAVLGAARVLARTLDQDTANHTLDLIAEYDKASQRLESYSQEIHSRDGRE